MAALYGVFLFMGITSFAGNELFERLELYFIWETKNLPKYHYVTTAVSRMHSFTFLQAACLAFLYSLTKAGGYVGIVTPFFIALLWPVRSLIFGAIFTKQDLALYDSAGDKESAASKDQLATKTPSKTPLFGEPNDSETTGTSPGLRIERRDSKDSKIYGGDGEDGLARDRLHRWLDSWEQLEDFATWAPLSYLLTPVFLTPIPEKGKGGREGRYIS